VGASRRKRPLVRLRHRWEDNIKMDVMELVWEAMYWIDLVDYRDMWWAVVNALMNLLVT
jgi:hypothetical protein